MPSNSKNNHAVLLLTVGLAGWLIPGGGHFIIKEKTRAIIIFTTIALTFAIGLYLGSIAVVNPVTSKLAYTAQIMNSPAVAAIGRITKEGHFTVVGKPKEIGEIYTSITGLLNLLCIVNAVYLAHIKNNVSTGA